MAIGLKPLGKRIIVRHDKAADKTEGGIVLPEMAQKKPTRGAVLAIGSEVTELKEGQRVLYQPYSAFPVPEMDDVVVLQLDDVIAVED